MRGFRKVSAMKFPKVTIYTTSTCVYCKMAKSFLNSHGVPYAEVDVGSDQKAADVMVNKSGQYAVPVIEVGRKIIVGFDKDALEKALGLG